MTRLFTAASALTLACTLAAPAMAQSPLAASPAIASAAALPLTDIESEDDAESYKLTPAAAAAPALAVSSGGAEVMVSAAALAAAAQGAPAPRDERFSVVMNQDAFFGFYPTFNGLIPVGENVDLSFYGILWTTPSFGNGGGSDLWTEFGIGANFISNEGKLQIKPQIGLTNGALLSRGVRAPNGNPTGTGSNFADGIVPSLTVNYADDTFEAEYYGGYYAALRNRNEVGSLDFLHTWINAGYKFTSNFSAGAHYELLSNTRTQGGGTAVVYQWVGPYVQFSLKKGFFARFTAGADIEEGNDGDFYKLAVGMSF
ncbi:MAG: DUF6733 family protein [Erythrobacter sp.]|jgi:hypothetical protein